MSMGSNMMGMQSPAHNSSCSSTHIPSMHSEAKLVSIHASIHMETYTSVYLMLYQTSKQWTMDWIV